VRRNSLYNIKVLYILLDLTFALEDMKDTDHDEKLRFSINCIGIKLLVSRSVNENLSTVPIIAFLQAYNIDFEYYTPPCEGYLPSCQYHTYIPFKAVYSMETDDY
jgi:hypothetical protein